MTFSAMLVEALLRNMNDCRWIISINKAPRNLIFFPFNRSHPDLLLSVYQEFDRLLEDQSPIEAYIEWLDSMVDRCVVRVSLAFMSFQSVEISAIKQDHLFTNHSPI